MSREFANALIVLDRYMDRVSAALKTARQNAGKDMLPGERFASVLPDGETSPGYIVRRKDSRDAYVQDEAVLMAHLQETDPDALEDVDEIDPEHLEQALAQLKVTFPEWVRSFVRINPKVLSGLLRAANDDNEKALPGIGFKNVPGSVAVYPDKKLTGELDQAIRAGAFPLDKVILQIEGTNGDQDS